MEPGAAASAFTRKTIVLKTVLCYFIIYKNVFIVKDK